jgi:hypothetical protein
MTSGYMPESMPEKGQRGFDQILGALREALKENPRLREMRTEEVARQLVLGGHLEGEPARLWSRRLSRVWRPRNKVFRTTRSRPRSPTPREQWIG